MSDSSSSSASSSSSSSSSTPAKPPAIDKKHDDEEHPVDEEQFADKLNQPAFRDDGMFRGADSEEPICPYDYDAPFSQDVFRSLDVLPAQNPTHFAGVHASAPKPVTDMDNGVSDKSRTGLELAMSLMLSTQPSRVLSPMPAFVEPNTTLYSAVADAPRIFDAVVNAISVFDDTQHVLHPKEFVVRAAMFNPSCVIFHVSLYESDSGIAIEFQRRSGDSVDFAKIYQHCNAQLQAENLVAKSNRGLRSFGCPPLPGFDDEATLDDTDFSRLLGMASSPFVDVAREGAGALANLSRHAPNLPCFRNAHAELAVLAAHRDVEVRRCAATILASMAFQWADAKQKLSAMVAKLQQSAVGSDQDLVLMELRRQVSRALAYMQ